MGGATVGGLAHRAGPPNGPASRAGKPMTVAAQALSDEDLMRAWQRGDALAFEQLYRRYRGTLYRFLVRQAGGEAAGEEIYQDVWMTLVRQRDAWAPTAALKTYLYRIAHSRLVDHYRKRHRQEPLAVSLDADDAPDVADTCELSRAESGWERSSTAEAVHRCLETLPPAQREAFLLKEESELGLVEIAEITGAEAETIKSRVRYAIAKLRRCLEGWL
jgi:RNA polymerase sigma-70 factor (ECF subfamily)